MPDDKFLDYYIEMSEYFLPNLSTFLILTESQSAKSIKSKNDNIYLIEKKKDSINKLKTEFIEDSVLIFHSFSLKDIDIILSLPSNVKRIWLFWGFEGYAAFPKNRFLGWKSHFAMYPNSLKGGIQFLLSRVKGRFITSNNFLPRKIIRKMDYCATWTKEDFKMAKSINPNLKFLYFCYYTKDLMDFPSLDIENTDFNKLFLGNSGAPTNNHIEALVFLAKCGFQGEIYCPLSYGGGQQYKENVIELGEKYFGRKFKPILKFLPLVEYQEIIAECGIVWMNHRRQQAAGNLFAAFFTGKIVITHPENPLNTSFTEWGLNHYSKDILKNLNTVKYGPLKNNRLILESELTINKNKDYFEKIESFL